MHDLAFLTMPDTVDRTASPCATWCPGACAARPRSAPPPRPSPASSPTPTGRSCPPVVVTPLGVDERWFACRARRPGAAAPDTPDARVRARLAAAGALPALRGHPGAAQGPAHAARRVRSGSTAEAPARRSCCWSGRTGWGPSERPVPGVRILGYLSQEDLPAVVGRRARARAAVPGRGLRAARAGGAGHRHGRGDQRHPGAAGGRRRLRPAFPVGDADALAATLREVVEHGPGAPTSAPPAARTPPARTWAACAEHHDARAYRLAGGG